MEDEASFINNPTKELLELRAHNESLISELESIRVSYQKSEEKLSLFEQEKAELKETNAEYSVWIRSAKDCFNRIIERISKEKSSVQETLGFFNEEMKDFRVEVEKVSKIASVVEMKISEFKEAREKEIKENFIASRSIRKSLIRVIESIDDEEEPEIEEEFRDILMEMKAIERIVGEVESKINEDKEMKEKDERENIRVLSENLVAIRSTKECLLRVIENFHEENESLREVDGIEEYMDIFSTEIKAVSKIANTIDSELSEYKSIKEKEKAELESSVVSLTEENRDINTLLRVALVEKEAVEKSLNRLKGNNEAKRGAILQIAERGLLKVGFGFMMGTGTIANEEVFEDNDSSTKSDNSECEEEVVSLAATMEKIMKNLRIEISQLKRSLHESRSDTERLQSLTEKQSQTINENAVYIKEMEDREALLTQSIDELLREIKETEEEVARWREACELEVEAAKHVVDEHEKVVLILKQELEKTKAALNVANGKLKLKEDLADAAMAAQAAGERSLQLADRRVAALNERIEDLTKQLEEAEIKGKNRRKLRRICWPFRVLKVGPSSKRMLPEMQALLH